MLWQTLSHVYHARTQTDIGKGKGFHALMRTSRRDHSGGKSPEKIWKKNKSLLFVLESRQGALFDVPLYHVKSRSDQTRRELPENTSDHSSKLHFTSAGTARYLPVQGQLPKSSTYRISIVISALSLCLITQKGYQQWYLLYKNHSIQSKISLLCVPEKLRGLAKAVFPYLKL